MSKKHVLSEKRYLQKEVSKSINELNKEISHVTKEYMLDPDTLESISKKASEIGNLYSNILSTLTLAQLNQNTLRKACQGTKNLIKGLKNTIEKYKEHDPFDSCIGIFERKLIEQGPILELYQWTLDLMWLPQSKRRQKAWKSRDIGIINKPFLPTSRLEGLIQDLQLEIALL